MKERSEVRSIAFPAANAAGEQRLADLYITRRAYRPLVVVVPQTACVPGESTAGNEAARRGLDVANAIRVGDDMNRHGKHARRVSHEPCIFAIVTADVLHRIGE